MRPYTIFLLILFGLAGHAKFVFAAAKKQHCRTVLGDPKFPTSKLWSALNSTIGGRLVKVLPSAQFCKGLPGGACNDTQWTSSMFRNEIPGAMNHVNWEQDYDSHPPSLCLRDSSLCNQGNVPLFAVAATSASDIQAGVKFAQTHNLRVAIKASGHDYLGRSTAKDSLLIWTHKLQDINFTEDFVVGKQHKGSAVTVGSGVTLNTLYEASKAQGKIFVGGTAATVVAAGGYIQGAGHSALSPTFGLAADNVLEFQVVTANAKLVTVNEINNPDLFWAMRGGGAGSWGVIVSATFQTFPTFNATFHGAKLYTNSTASMGDLATLHAKHIFDWDSYHAGQYFYVSTNASTNGTTPPNLLLMATFFPNADSDQAAAAMKPFLDDAQAQGVVIQQSYVPLIINDLLFTADDVVGDNMRPGSRLLPASIYQNSPEKIGSIYKQLLDGGTTNILGHLVAGGKVAENANVQSAVNPKWRTAKTHIIIQNEWSDSASPADIEAIKHVFATKQLPLLQQLAGEGSGAYSNEADVLEQDFQTTFFGPNYERLSQIKTKYDPNDLFIVGAGVGSERWDAAGLCRV